MQTLDDGLHFQRIKGGTQCGSVVTYQYDETIGPHTDQWLDDAPDPLVYRCTHLTDITGQTAIDMRVSKYVDDLARQRFATLFPTLFHRTRHQTNNLEEHIHDLGGSMNPIKKETLCFLCGDLARKHSSGISQTYLNTGTSMRDAMRDT